MAFTILSILAGLIACLPTILKMVQAKQQRTLSGAKGAAHHDATLLDTVLPPPPGGV